MTDQHSDTNTEEVINEALGVIDSALAKMMSRELVSGGEVADLLLDVRSLLTPEQDVVPAIETIETVSSDAV